MRPWSCQQQMWPLAGHVVFSESHDLFRAAVLGRGGTKVNRTDLLHPCFTELTCWHCRHLSNHSLQVIQQCSELFKHQASQEVLSSKESTHQCRGHKRHRFKPLVVKISWRTAWQPTPVFLPGNPTDRGAWWATAHGVTESQTRLKWLCTQTHNHHHHNSFLDYDFPAWSITTQQLGKNH